MDSDRLSHSPQGDGPAEAGAALKVCKPILESAATSDQVSQKFGGGVRVTKC
jgi:hypothetical protein